jgi:hypothetical protein
MMEGYVDEERPLIDCLSKRLVEDLIERKIVGNNGYIHTVLLSPHLSCVPDHTIIYRCTVR